MKVLATELEKGDVLLVELEAGCIADLERLAAHVRVTFADGQARSYQPDEQLVLTCARLAACPRDFCAALGPRACECKPCGCRVCRRRAELVAERTAA